MGSGHAARAEGSWAGVGREMEGGVFGLGIGTEVEGAEAGSRKGMICDWMIRAPLRGYNTSTRLGLFSMLSMACRQQAAWIRALHERGIRETCSLKSALGRRNTRSKNTQASDITLHVMDHISYHFLYTTILVILSKWLDSVTRPPHPPFPKA